MCKWNDIAILYTKILKVHNPHYLLLQMGTQMVAIYYDMQRHLSFFAKIKMTKLWLETKSKILLG
jgi:hypothetical protein